MHLLLEKTVELIFLVTTKIHVVSKMALVALKIKMASKIAAKNKILNKNVVDCNGCFAKHNFTEML